MTSAKINTMKKRKKIKLDTFDIINFIFLTSLMLIIIVPFYYTVVKSFMSQQEYIFEGTRLWPKNPTLANYRDIFVSGTITSGFKNSVINTVLGVAYSMFLTMTLGYGLSKKSFPGRKLFQSLIVFTMYFGGGLIPFFLQIKNFGWVNSRMAIIIPSGLSIFNMIILRSFFEQLPEDLEEAALLDGAGMLRIFWQIHLPLVKPALATLTLFYSVDRWNEWFHSSLFLGDGGLWPIQLVLRQILWATSSFEASVPPEAGRKIFGEGIKAASVLVTIVPIMTVYPFMQKYFVKGVMIGAIKS